MNYRRAYIPGGTFFFALVTYQRRKLFKEHSNIKLLQSCIKKIKQQYPFKMRAYVILPDHLHCIWTLPDNDTDYSTRWRLIKSYFTRTCLQNNIDVPSKSRVHKKEKCTWQRRFWEHAIIDENDFTQHVDYINYNPVKYGYVADPSDWLYSSFNFYKNKGGYPQGWGVDDTIGGYNFQE